MKYSPASQNPLQAIVKAYHTHCRSEITWGLAWCYRTRFPANKISTGCQRKVVLGWRTPTGSIIATHLESCGEGSHANIYMLAGLQPLWLSCKASMLPIFHQSQFTLGCFRFVCPSGACWSSIYRVRRDWGSDAENPSWAEATDAQCSWLWPGGGMALLATFWVSRLCMREY